MPNDLTTPDLSKEKITEQTSKRRPFEALPSEILVSILENLSYGDLQLRIPLVCKRWNRIIQKQNPESASKIDCTLWRDAPRKLPADAEKNLPAINNVFPKFIFLYTTDINDVSIRNTYVEPDTEAESGTKKVEKIEKLVDLAVRNQNATSPAVNVVTLHTDLTSHGYEPPYEVVGTGGGGAVTVLDVMNGVVEIVKRKAEDPDKRGYLGWGDDGFDDVKVLDGKLHLYDGMRPGYGNQ